MTLLVLFEVSTNKKLFVSWKFSGTYGVIKYGSGWRKDVINQCLEFATTTVHPNLLMCYTKARYLDASNVTTETVTVTLSLPHSHCQYINYIYLKSNNEPLLPIPPPPCPLFSSFLFCLLRLHALSAVFTVSSQTWQPQHCVFRRNNL